MTGRTLRTIGLGIGIGLGPLLAAACSGGEPPLALSPEAERGRTIAIDRGCSSCHGGDFAGGVAPSWIGLVGSDVPLPGGTTIVADREYVIESIVDPDAVRRVGMTMPMPRVSLTDDEVRLIADYIVELGV